MLKKIVIYVLAIWIVAVFGYVKYHRYLIATGQEVLLTINPYDKRPIYQDKTLRFYYDIGKTETDKYKISDLNPDKYVFVTLNVDDNRIATIENVSTKKPEKGALYLKGTVGSRWYADDNHIGFSINYGIEKYKVSEEQGKKLEQEIKNGAFVRVRIYKNGQADIRSIQRRA